MNMRMTLTRVAVVAVCALPMAGCDAIGDLILGENYSGPQPAAEGISNEVAVVRSIDVVPGYVVLLLDRERYTAAGDPHNVNRVIRVSSGDAGPENVAALNLSRGDRVVVSTEYRGTRTVEGTMSVPDWPGHTAREYPIGFHYITAIARVDP